MLDAATDWLERNRFDASADSIRRFRHQVLSSPKDDPRRGAISSTDFFTTSTCRDLLFHVQEHRFTLPRIKRILDDLGLKFIGFESEDPAPGRLYRHSFPDDPDMTDLGHWDQLERDRANLFACMYQFWCQKA